MQHGWWRDPLITETVTATLLALGLSAVIGAIYYLTTGHSPWPHVFIGSMAGLGFGIAALALTSPRRQR
ncbi:MAG: hypothetical protein FJ033_00530 [Chloroflexi bacterium]|nr:hypothetical protein [Chloroflexota bacterium]